MYIICIPVYLHVLPRNVKSSRNMIAPKRIFESLNILGKYTRMLNLITVRYRYYWPKNHTSVYQVTARNDPGVALNKNKKKSGENQNQNKKKMDLIVGGNIVYRSIYLLWNVPRIFPEYHTRKKHTAVLGRKKKSWVSLEPIGKRSIINRITPLIYDHTKYSTAACVR